MGVIYSASFSATAVSAAVDVFELLVPSTGKPIVLHEVVIAQSSDYGDAAAEGLSVLIKRATGAYTSGSGGSTATPVAHSSIFPAPGITAVETNNTSQAAAGSGALTTLRAEAFNVQGGYQYLPMPAHRPVFARSEACVVSITAPADAVTLSATIVFEEL